MPRTTEHMLCFSSSTKDDTFPYYNHHTPPPPPPSSTPSFLTNAGLFSGSSNTSMNGVLARVRGPFTPSQWMELEHQALIYKYIVANAPIPSSLLIPIRRSLNPSGFPPFSAPSFGSSTLGWGNFQLGFPGNADPEPGRCRRTDGKKWRCSRDAVADQKYCERHMNRGRHRSRKHVEGRSGHAAARPSPTSSQAASSAVLSTAEQQAKSLGPSTTADPCPAPFNRMLMGKEKVNDYAADSQRLSMLTSMSQKPIDSSFPISKQHNPFEEAAFSDNINFLPAPKLNENSQTHPLRHFFDDWPKNHSDSSSLTWHEVEEMQCERTQLSISIPMTSSDFSSSSSPTHEKLTLSPPRLSRESEFSQKQVNWVPISWESSIGGPLGEVLNNTNSTIPKDQSKNLSSSSLNLSMDGWDLESSPSGVLQKANFGSVSSSTGSSPRPENPKAYESHKSSGSLCNEILGSGLANSLTMPSF
ncbi:growth-regulating factor 6-like isoform X2 [Ananas comosus]|uniref:Growth-regulating factor n=1 Tax=Ananas comosus TaxID=4615 RepID=A0A6P5GFK9_ANACO|nr:growth-regulating factor 6-like isoform X2 [Ananas comosus]